MSDYPLGVLQIPIASLVVVLVLGSMLLAIWTVTRFERLGPRTLGGTLLAAGTALALLTGLGDFAQAVAAAGVPATRLVVAIGLVVPVLTYCFVASVWVMRAARDLLDGLL
ncbi:MAG TPA: hypothetical protein VFA82_01885 [Gaiellaceae bacterium]|nr:hypothetical protein [Gaiellaceae bacterium]